MDLFRAEKITELPSDKHERTCSLCSDRLQLIRSFVDLSEGKIIHTFECRCGGRIWDD